MTTVDFYYEIEDLSAAAAAAAAKALCPTDQEICRWGDFRGNVRQMRFVSTLPPEATFSSLCHIIVVANLSSKCRIFFYNKSRNCIYEVAEGCQSNLCIGITEFRMSEEEQSC